MKEVIVTIKDNIATFSFDCNGQVLYGAFIFYSVSDIEVEQLIKERNQLKQSKEYSLADEIRTKLYNAGVTLRDNKDGTSEVFSDSRLSFNEYCTLAETRIKERYNVDIKLVKGKN